VKRESKVRVEQKEDYQGFTDPRTEKNTSNRVTVALFSGVLKTATHAGRVEAVVGRLGTYRQPEGDERYKKQGGGSESVHRGAPAITPSDRTAQKLLAKMWLCIKKEGKDGFMGGGGGGGG